MPIFTEYGYWAVFGMLLICGSGVPIREDVTLATGGVIAGLQAIQFMIADMTTEYEAARLLTLRAAFLKDKGVKHTAESAMAKLFASEACTHIAHKAIQVHGGYGYITEYAVERAAVAAVDTGRQD